MLETVFFYYIYIFHFNLTSLLFQHLQTRSKILHFLSSFFSPSSSMLHFHPLHEAIYIFLRAEKNPKEKKFLVMKSFSFHFVYFLIPSSDQSPPTAQLMKQRTMEKSFDIHNFYENKKRKLRHPSSPSSSWLVGSAVVVAAREKSV